MIIPNRQFQLFARVCLSSSGVFVFWVKSSPLRKVSALGPLVFSVFDSAVGWWMIDPIFYVGLSAVSWWFFWDKSRVSWWLEFPDVILRIEKKTQKNQVFEAFILNLVNFIKTTGHIWLKYEDFIFGFRIILILDRQETARALFGNLVNLASNLRRRVCFYESSCSSW